MAENEDFKQENDDQEDDEDVMDDSGYKTVKDAVLFAIDVSESMLTPPPDTGKSKADRDSPTSAALKCAYQLMQQRIISNPNDMMGVLLFGTEKSRFQGDELQGSNMAYPHCYLLTDLDVPAAEDVKRLRDLVESEQESAELLVPSKEPVTMSSVLFCANQIFTTRAPNFSSRRLFLVTDNDNPHQGDKRQRSAAAVRAKDLYDLGVKIELFPISRLGHGFDRTLFYDDIVYRAIPSDPEAPAPVSAAIRDSKSGDGISLLQSLLSNINSKSTPRRALFSLPFEIGPGFKIGVKGYILFKRQAILKTCYVWVGGEKVQIAVGSTQQLAEDTARTVEKTEIRKAFKFGGENISFGDDELKKLRNFGEPVLRIIGFKDMDLLPVWASYRSSYFVYPSETDFIGSTRVFSALQQNLLKKRKFALTWFIPRRNATPVLVAAIPGAEKLADDGTQQVPPGLWLVSLPFADDIRQNPETEQIRAPDSLVDRMRVIIQQLQLPKGVYDPKKYPNPSLQWFYRVLQSMALEEDVPEEPEDKTVPRHRQIAKRAGEYVIEWGHELEKALRELKISTSASAGGKRKAASSEDHPALAKRAKTSQTTAHGDGDAPHLDDAAMRALWEKGDIAKLKVAELKDWAAAKKMPVAGKKKAELVGMCEAWFEGRG